MTRNLNIDFYKGLAAISVIILHALSTDTLLKLLAPLHIWQAVPVFMMITGINVAESYKRKKIHSLNQLFTVSDLIRKFSKILIPFLLVWCAQVIINGKMSFLDLVISFLTGGWGSGSYYIPLAIQAIIITPILYFFIKIKSHKSLLVLLIISLLLESMVVIFDVSSELYRILIIRYFLLYL